MYYFLNSKDIFKNRLYSQVKLTQCSINPVSMSHPYPGIKNGLVTVQKQPFKNPG